MSMIRRVNRREFLKLTGLAGTGLVLGVTLPGDEQDAVLAAAADGGFSPDVFLELTPAGHAVVWVSRSEMGQGVRTGLPMIVAEELDIAWENIRIRQADGAADNRYGRQLTGGSYSVRMLYDRLRRVGAVARDMLVTAAAERWGVEPAACTTELGNVRHEASGRRSGYGDLAAAAAALPVPDPNGVRLKDPEAFRLIGTRVRRRDAPDLLAGAPRFGADIRVPGLLYAAVARSPAYGGKVADVDAASALKVDGVRQVVEVEGRDDNFYLAPGVAVVAESTWAAFEGVRKLRVRWDDGPNRGASTASLGEHFRELARERGEIVKDDGDAEGAFRTASNVVEAAYGLPFLAHAPMEPMNCTIHVRPRSCEIWSPTQNPQAAQRLVAEYLGLPQEAVTVHVTLLGGGFGRRLYPDFELEAAMIARQIDGPVMVVWSREDDIRHDRYRPSSHHVLRGAVDGTGVPVAWWWRILNTHTERFDPSDFPAYAVPNYHVEYSHVPWILPRGAWRATTLSQNPFIVQSFLDELAAVGGRDPLELRLEMLRRATRPDSDETNYDSRRMVRVLETVAEKAGWGRSLPAGRGRGVAFQFCYGSYVAEVAEVEVTGGRVRVRRVVCAVDCGQVINPDLVEAQVEGAITFGLSAALKQEITVERGRVGQGNFDDYEMLRIGEMPEVETYILPSREPPGGMGETPLPPAAPAVANAIYDATGKRVRTLPIRLV